MNCKKNLASKILYVFNICGKFYKNEWLNDLLEIASVLCCYQHWETWTQK